MRGSLSIRGQKMRTGFRPSPLVVPVALDEAADAFEGAFDLFVAAGVAGAHKAFAAGAEGTARNNRDAFFGEQSFAEGDAVHPGHTDFGERVERAPRFEGGQ